MTVRIGNIDVGGSDLVIIAGPCVIESKEHTLKLAASLQDIMMAKQVPFIFKTSFDKANRTAVESFRGPGLDKGLQILQEVKEAVGIPVLTDIHSPDQTGPVAEVVDVLQIPAFLCRQTDLLIAAGKTGKCINVKKGQFLAPHDAANIVAKIESTSNRRILLTERGTSFGYNNLVADMRSIPVMKATGYPVVFDATHSAQHPGELGQSTGGDRGVIPVLAKAAVAAGCDAVFMEVHDDVEHARSDAATQWPLQKTAELVDTLRNIFQVIREKQ